MRRAGLAVALAFAAVASAQPAMQVNGEAADLKDALGTAADLATQGKDGLGEATSATIGGITVSNKAPEGATV